MDSKQLNVKVYTHGTLAFVTSEAFSIYKEVLQQLREHRDVVLSFAGIEIVTPRFLRESVGRILRTIEGTSLGAHFKVKDLCWQGQMILNKITEDAKPIKLPNKLTIPSFHYRYTHRPFEQRYAVSGR